MLSTKRTPILAAHGWRIATLVSAMCHKVCHKRRPSFTLKVGTNNDVGCACDIPSHAYTLNFALNPDWPRFFSYAPDIQKYLLKVVEVFDLRKYMTFNTEVVRSEWQDDSGKWRVSLRQKSPSGETKEWDEECDLLLYATGILNNYKWPQIKGMDKFKGKVVHTAIWPEEYQEEEWKNDRVAVIGSGASSIQTVPKMQPHAKHLDIFVRTGVWFVQIANNYGQNKEYSPEERDEFRRDPKKLLAHAKDIENQVNGLWGAFYTGSEAQKGAQQLFRERMKEFIKDERLLQGFTPKFEVGCECSNISCSHTTIVLTLYRPPHHSWRSLHARHPEGECRCTFHSSG